MSVRACRQLWQRQQRFMVPPEHGSRGTLSSVTSLSGFGHIQTGSWRQIRSLCVGSKNCRKAGKAQRTSEEQAYHSQPKLFISTTSRSASGAPANANYKSNTSSPNGVSHKRAQSRSILITGGTSGIGFAVARQAILEGASHVRLITRDAQRGKSALDRLRDETSTDIELDYVEAETEEYMDAKLFETDTTTTSTNAKFTTIVHCAGISQTSLLTSTRAEDIKKVLSVNLESAALLTKAQLKRYMQTSMALSRKSSTSSSSSSSSPPPPQSWQIINISSLLATKGGRGTSVYAATKAGLVALTRATALEAADITQRYGPTAPGFRANVVLPGYIETPMTHAISGLSREKLLQDIPAGRFGSPDEVADAVMFLVGNEYANNCVLNLDGGLSAV